MIVSNCVSDSTWRHCKGNSCMKSDHIDGHSSFAQVRMIPYTPCPILPESSCTCISQSYSMALSGYNFVRWNQSATPSASHLCMKHGVDCCMSGHCCHFALNESQPGKVYLATIGGYLSLVCAYALPNLSPAACCLAFLSSSPPKPYLHISSKTFQPTVAESIGHYQNVPKTARSRKHLKTSKHCLPDQGSISKLFQTFLSPENGPMLLLQKPSYPYFLPLVEGTKFGLPHPFGKLLQGVFRMFQADWGFAFETAKVRQIVALICCIIFIIGNLRQWGQSGDSCNICHAQFCSQLKLFCWEANGGSLRCAGKLSWCSGGWSGWPKIRIVSRRCWRH